MRAVISMVALGVVVIVATKVPVERPRSVSCRSQVRQLLGAMLRYAEDRDQTLPSEWSALPPNEHVENLIGCYYPEGAGAVKHIMASRWSGVSLDAIPDPESAILIYEAVDGQPIYRPNPGYRSMAQKVLSRLARRGMTIGYADGHCRWASNRLTPEMILEGRDPFVAKRSGRQP